jgi:hypothetical protein
MNGEKMELFCFIVSVRDIVPIRTKMVNNNNNFRAVLFYDIGDFNLLVADGGRLHLEVHVYSTQTREQMVTYTDSFCLDATNRLVVFCPCSKLPCVRKCCYDGFAYNTSLSRCVDTGNHDTGFWRPSFQVGYVSSLFFTSLSQ